MMRAAFGQGMRGVAEQRARSKEILQRKVQKDCSKRFENGAQRSERSIKTGSGHMAIDRGKIGGAEKTPRFSGFCDE
jgi:hypothetical protein